MIARRRTDGWTVLALLTVLVAACVISFLSGQIVTANYVCGL